MPEPAPPPSRDARDWLRQNLFRSWGDAVLTVVASVVVGAVLYLAARFVFVTGRWDIVRTNLTLFMVGRYPRDELWRVSLSLCCLAAYGGVLAGFVHRRQLAAGRAGPELTVRARVVDIVGRLWPLLLGTLVLLSLSETIGPWLLALGVVAAAVVGRVVGGHLGRRWLWPVVAVGIVGPILLIALLTAGASWNEWGGMMLNVFLAAAGIGLSFPLGVLLALGRRAGRRTDSIAGGVVLTVLLAAPFLLWLLHRGFAVDDAVSWALLGLTIGLGFAGFAVGRHSTLPIVRVLSVAYIEFFRGVPLFVLLLLGAIAIGFFLPVGMDPPGLVVRAIIVFTVFTAAYLAEIVRGGLQSLPRGQTEAAQALGLSPVRMNALIVLPQALRNVIPSIVGQFISLFKDTTLAGAAMGFLDLLEVSDAARSQPDYRGQDLTAETVVFVMFLFWVGCITMSRESQRLERKLGVGVR